ncbi:hypothetical protein [Microseira wollei]|nr:hypothetical protein [Microseira wollei]
MTSVALLLPFNHTRYEFDLPPDQNSKTRFLGQSLVPFPKDLA